jgi:hypothetical protein
VASPGSLDGLTRQGLHRPRSVLRRRYSGLAARGSRRGTRTVTLWKRSGATERLGRSRISSGLPGKTARSTSECNGATWVRWPTVSGRFLPAGRIPPRQRAAHRAEVGVLVALRRAFDSDRPRRDHAPCDGCPQQAGCDTDPDEFTVRDGIRPSESTRIALADKSETPTSRNVRGKG